MLLADAAQVADGKLYILGGGWSVTGPNPVPSAIAIKIEVPWDQANKRHLWELVLVDSDGTPTMLGGTEGPLTLQFGGEFEVGRPPGLPEGTPLDSTIAIGLGPLPLLAGRAYTWRLRIDGRTSPDWELRFLTRPAPVTVGT